MIASDQKLATWLKWVLGILAAAVLSPVITAALNGVVSLGLAILVAFGITVFVTQVMPVLSAVIATYAMKLLKWNAASNPIETLQNQLVEREQQLAEMQTRIADFDTNARTFKGKVRELKQQFPNDSSDFDQQVAQMDALLAQQRHHYQDAAGKLQLFRAEITKAKAKWEVALAAQGAFKSAGKARQNALQAIQKETALDSVELEMNRAFANLSTALDSDIPAKVVQNEARNIQRLGVQP